MTIQKALDLADQLKPNMMSTQVKIEFLNELEGKIFHELVLTHAPSNMAQEAFFIGRMAKLIAEELLLASLQQKADVVDFIKKIRGAVHEQILFNQGYYTSDTMIYMELLEGTLQARVNDQEQYTKAQLVSFLEDVQETLENYAGPSGTSTPPTYSTDTDTGTELLAPAPYDMCYVYWLMTKIDHMNQEIDKMNNDRALFENSYGELSDWWTRTRMPIQATREFKL